MDALLTQRSIAQQILRQGGHYLMVVKGNQRELCLTIAELFTSPPWLPSERQTHCRKYSQVCKGHGRLETRTLESSWALNEYVSGYLHWPGSKQVLRRTCQRVILKTGQISEQVTYGITSLGWDQADAKEIERLWRGHWTIENRSHYVRDVTMGEDANQMRVGNAPQVLAALRNGLVSLLRVSGWQSIAEGLRHYGASVHCALHLINSPLLRL